MHSLIEVQNLLLDMDGTIYLGRNLIEGAGEFLRYLRDSGRGYLFFTNNPSSDAEAYCAKLKRMGIDAVADDILTAGEATARYLAGSTCYRRVYVLGTPSFESELQRAGLILDAQTPDAVVLSFDKTLTYEKLEKAALFLSAGLPYIATNPDRVCPTDYGAIPDCGSIAALLESATGRAPHYVGKPHPLMVQMGLKKLGAAAENTGMVGDRLYTDMEMAYRSGIASILVLSGETTPEAAACADRPPDFIFSSVQSLHQALAAADAAV